MIGITHDFDSNHNHHKLQIVDFKAQSFTRTFTFGHQH